MLMATGRISEMGEDAIPLLGSRNDAQLSDGHLLELYVTHRDQTAFAALVERYSGMVLGVCERVLRDRHLAEDAFQATFLVLVRRADSLDGQRSLCSWLYAVAYRTALKARAIALKRRARERQVLDMPAVQPTEEAVWSDLKPVLDEELNKLPAKYRAPLILCCLHGKTHQQAARELGWPSGSMSRRMTRARELLRKRLTRRGIFLSAGVLVSLLFQRSSATAASATLKATTVKAAMAFGAGILGAGMLGTAGLASASVITLTHAVLKTTAIGTGAKLSAGLKTVIIVVLLGLIGLTGFIAVSFFIPGRSAFGLSSGAHCAPASTGPGTPLAGWELGGTLAEHGNEIVSVALAADGKLLASASTGENFVRVWEPATGLEIAQLRGHDGVIQAVTFTPAGHLLASASADHTLKLWREGHVLATLDGHNGGVLCAAFSPDGRTLASGSEDRTIKIWDIATRQLRSTLAGHEGPVSAVAFSPDGRTLASGSQDGTAKIWDLSTGRERFHLKQHSEPVTCLAFSPDGKNLATGSADRTVALWDTPQYSLRAVLKGHVGSVNSLVFTPDAKLLITGGQDKTVKVWNTTDLQEVASLQGHSASVNSVALARDTLALATGSSDRTIRLWRMGQRLKDVK
jgi:RNA polymerase sigma factor (sigma-70 family)